MNERYMTHTHNNDNDSDSYSYDDDDDDKYKIRIMNIKIHSIQSNKSSNRFLFLACTVPVAAAVLLLNDLLLYAPFMTS